MQDNFGINDDLKNIILSDNDVVKCFLISLLKQVYEKNEFKDNENGFYKQDYDLYEWILYEKDKDLHASLLEVLKETLNINMVNKVINEYNELLYNEATNIIYTLSRLLYIQNKYKDESIGKKIDYFIKLWLEYIKNEKTDEVDLNDKTLTDEQRDEGLSKINARIFSHIIPSVCLEINKYRENTKIANIFVQDDDKTALYRYLKDHFKSIISDTTTYNRYTNHTINGFINNLIEYEELANFEIKYYDKIKALKDKYPNYDDLEIPSTIQLYELKEYGDGDKKLLNKLLDNDYVNNLYLLWLEYDKKDEYKIINNDDVKKWRNKADKYINHIKSLKGISDINMFDLNYLLDYLYFSDYQKEAYNLNNINSYDFNKSKIQLSKKELNEKYREITKLNGQELDYNRKWARLDTSKLNANIMNMREEIVKKVSYSTNLTRKRIIELESIKKPSKEDLKELKELKDQFNEQVKKRDDLKKEISDLYADISLLNEQLANTTNIKEQRAKKRKIREINKQIKSKEDYLKDEGLYFQIDTENKLLVNERQDKKTKEKYRLVIDGDYDLQNFNQEGRNFLYYIPNIPNIITTLDEDFIPIDINDYLEFTGRPNGNVSRIRNNLQKTLKEMRKEHYDYTYKDEKGVYHDDSLVILGDIRGTEYKGKATIKVQLGATFKENLKTAIAKNQYVKVNSNVFKIGQGKNNKAENMAKEIFTYLSKLCRAEAKQQTQTGQWQKDLHLETIIKHLCDINLLNYNPNRYNETVKEPLKYALNVGQELGLFTYQTDAFSYYDDVISSLNWGANVQDKIDNFEKGKPYGIKFILNSDMIDLEANHKANRTYNANKKRYDKKATNK